MVAGVLVAVAVAAAASAAVAAAAESSLQVSVAGRDSAAAVATAVDPSSLRGQGRRQASCPPGNTSYPAGSGHLCPSSGLIPSSPPATWRMSNIGTQPATFPQGGWSWSDTSSPLGSDGVAVVGGGGAISGYSDSFHFLWRPADEDFFQATMRLVDYAPSSPSTRPGTKAGLMFRASSRSTEQYMAVLHHGERRLVTIQWRNGTSLTTRTQTIATQVDAPVMLRITRTGSTNLQGSCSTDGGATWTEGTYQPNFLGLPSSFQWGLAASFDSPNATLYGPTTVRADTFSVEAICPNVPCMKNCRRTPDNFPDSPGANEYDCTCDEPNTEPPLCIAADDDSAAAVPVGVIIGSVGGAVVLAMIIVGVVVVLRRRSSSGDADAATGQPAAGPGDGHSTLRPMGEEDDSLDVVGASSGPTEWVVDSVITPVGGHATLTSPGGYGGGASAGGYGSPVSSPGSASPGGYDVPLSAASSPSGRVSSPGFESAAGQPVAGGTQEYGDMVIPPGAAGGGSLEYGSMAAPPPQQGCDMEYTGLPNPNP